MAWVPGEEILWCYRREVRPVIVVADGENELAVWLPSGTPQLAAAPCDGRPIRDRPLRERFRVARHFVIRPWTGPGILMIAPRGAAHSLWLFRKGDGSFWGWYANLEAVHRRGKHAVQTADHVLDVWLDAAGTPQWKDEDELEAAVEAGLFTSREAEEIRAEGQRVMDAMLARHAPFDGSRWLDWTPDPSWPAPTLPDWARQLAGHEARPIDMA